jgi:LPXTG-motif cell wall-anchored protein
MTKVSVVVLLLTASYAFAGIGPRPVPEIDPSVGIGALALLSGGLLLLRSRRKS